MLCVILRGIGVGSWVLSDFLDIYMDIYGVCIYLHVCG